MAVVFAVPAVEGGRIWSRMTVARAISVSSSD